MIRVMILTVTSLLLAGNLLADENAEQPAADKTPQAKAAAPTADAPNAADARDARRRGLRGEGSAHRGRVTKAALENGVLKLTVDGKEYEFAVSDHTHAMLRTMDKDGQQVVIGLQMMNADGRQARRRSGNPPRTRPKANSTTSS